MCCSEYHVGPAGGMYESCCQTTPSGGSGIEPPRHRRLLHLIFPESIGPTKREETPEWVCYVHCNGKPVEGVEVELLFPDRFMHVEGIPFSDKQGLIRLAIRPYFDCGKITIKIDVHDAPRLKDYTHVKMNAYPEKDLEATRSIQEATKKQKRLELNNLKGKIMHDLREIECRLMLEVNKALKELS